MPTTPQRGTETLRTNRKGLPPLINALLAVDHRDHPTFVWRPEYNGRKVKKVRWRYDFLTKLKRSKETEYNAHYQASHAYLYKEGKLLPVPTAPTDPTDSLDQLLNDSSEEDTTLPSFVTPPPKPKSKMSATTAPPATPTPALPFAEPSTSLTTTQEKADAFIRVNGQSFSVENVFVTGRFEKTIRHGVEEVHRFYAVIIFVLSDADAQAIQTTWMTPTRLRIKVPNVPIYLRRQMITQTSELLFELSGEAQQALHGLLTNTPWKPHKLVDIEFPTAMVARFINKELPTIDIPADHPVLCPHCRNGVVEMDEIVRSMSFEVEEINYSNAGVEDITRSMRRRTFQRSAYPAHPRPVPPVPPVPPPPVPPPPVPPTPVSSAWQFRFPALTVKPDRDVEMIDLTAVAEPAAAAAAAPAPQRLLEWTPVVGLKDPPTAGLKKTPTAGLKDPPTAGLKKPPPPPEMKQGVLLATASFASKISPLARRDRGKKFAEQVIASASSAVRRMTTRAAAAPVYPPAPSPPTLEEVTEELDSIPEEEESLEEEETTAVDAAVIPASSPKKRDSAEISKYTGPSTRSKKIVQEVKKARVQEQEEDDDEVNEDDDEEDDLL